MNPRNEPEQEPAQKLDSELVAAAQLRVHTACLRLVSDGLVVGSAGNISERVGQHHFVVSPGGHSYEDLTATQYPVVDARDGSFSGPLAPTSELALHRSLYQERPEVHSIVHTHSKFAAAFAVARIDLPFICNENIGPASEHILVTDYAAPGTSDLGAQALATFARQPGSSAVLLANHGVVAIGPTVAKAYVIAAQVEWIAEVTLHASQLRNGLQGVTVLSHDMQNLIGKNYGFAVARQPETKD